MWDGSIYKFKEAEFYNISPSNGPFLGWDMAIKSHRDDLLNAVRQAQIGTVDIIIKSMNVVLPYALF